jgi:hypothetical protein
MKYLLLEDSRLYVYGSAEMRPLQGRGVTA